MRPGSMSAREARTGVTRVGSRAAEASQWLKHWLQHLCSPPTTAFILACAEEEVAALTGGADGPQTPSVASLRMFPALDRGGGQ